MNNSIPASTVLQVGEVRRFNDLKGIFVGRLTQERLDVYLRGRSSYSVEIPSDKEVDMFEESGVDLLEVLRY